jgi:RecB family exonuclease
VWSLGTAGGNAAHPRGALEWSERAAFRQGDLARQLESARGAADDPERSGLARRARDLERLLADLQAIRPALDALVGVARDVVNGRSLGEVWPALRAFLEEWLLQPGAGPRAPALLDERLAGVADDRGLSELRGDDALRLIEDAVTSIRLPGGRFGDPAVYVGSITGAAGLRFRAVRMIGLAEGHLPPVPREDPVLPDALRARLAAPAAGGRSIAPPTARDVALRALHALDAAVRDAETCVALSVPRVDVARSLREPASIILEAAAALGRPNAATGERRRVIPDTPALRRDAFAPARQALVEFRRLMPIGETAWQDGVALCVLGVPGRWRVSDARDLDRVVALLGAAGPGPLDGILGAVAAKVKVPGLTPEWPISPSVLQALLQCPYQFLLGHFLGLEEPASAPARREIGQPAYGSLFHVVAEQFYRTHGAAFSAGEGNLENWLERADVIVDQTFAEFLEQYPLIGAAVRSRERERLRGDLRDLLEHGWLPEGGRRFVAVERAFGWPAPVELPLGRRSLFVRGYVDRIEVDGRLALVRDLKTGRAHPRIGGEREPDPALDVQIAVYGLVAARLAREWDIPERVGVAYTYVGRGADEREYRLDFHQTLEPAARRWLTVAADLLAERAFPRTADPGDCEYCAFRPVCGDGVYERAARLIRGGRAALRAFGAMKGVEIDAEPRP